MHEHKLGVVVIGRNEGERLLRCLSSVLQQALATVYVDSGSSDGSPRKPRTSGPKWSISTWHNPLLLQGHGTMACADS